MEHATMSHGFMERRALLEIGGVEVPWGQVGILRWEDIPKDSLPVILQKSTAPKAMVCANRMQFDAFRKDGQEYVRECYIIEIKRIMAHSNLSYCETLIELDRKFRHKKRAKMLSNVKKILMKDIIQNLNRTKTAAEIAAEYNTSAFSITIMASKLRKPPYNFNIPGARGYDDFAVFADEIAKENPELLKKPLVSRQSAILKNGHKPVLLRA